ncbi:MAG: hypothetical protein ACRDGS_02555, partial [Chloroflexota bacterium]
MLDQLRKQLDLASLLTVFEGLLQAPLSPNTLEHAVRMLEATRDPEALKLLVTQSDVGQSRVVRRAAKGAIFRLRQAVVSLPVPEPVQSPHRDAAAWPVAGAWATRIDCIGSQAVYLARRRPNDDVAFISVVLSDDRGVVDGMGELGTSLRAVEKLAQRSALPPGAPLNVVPPEYIPFRVRQGLETSRRAKRVPAADYQRWSFLLNGLDDTWELNLEGLSGQWADPGVLDQTGALLSAIEFSDWWPDPESKTEGAATRRFLQDVQRDLDQLATPTEPPSDLSAMPPILGNIASETHFLASLWPYTAEATAAIERRIDEHLERILPKGRQRRFRDALLQMAYLADLGGRTTMRTLISTAAWAMDPASGIGPRDQPLLRQMLRKCEEVNDFYA